MNFDTNFGVDTKRNHLLTIEAGGERRILGCLPPDQQKRMMFKGFSEEPKLRILTDDEIEAPEYDVEPLWIKDQDGENSCTGQGTSAGFEDAWADAGYEPTKFSANYVYAHVNGNHDNGAMVSDCMGVLLQGICKEELFPQGRSIYKKDIPESAFLDAKNHIADQLVRLDSVKEMISATLLDCSIVFGIDLGSNFNPDKNGILPPYRPTAGRGYAGHCMNIKRMGIVIIANKIYFKVRNSWSTKFGKNGICFMPTDYISNNKGVDAFAIISVKGDKKLPKVA